MVQEVAQTAQLTQQALSTDGGQLITSQLASAALMVYLLQWVKKTRLVPFISEHTTGINRAINFLLAIAAAIGIHYSFDVATGTLVITGLHWSSVLHGTWEVAKQWAFQQGMFDTIFGKAGSNGSGSGTVNTGTSIIRGAA